MMIRGYQLMVSPWTKNCCRFYPSCSSYAKESFQKHGFLGGLYFTLRRLLRCHPFHSGGFDPVPNKRVRPYGH
ncbi:MAG: membrane protein insertion efficiency factor YidD [Coxiellaceae bacterium]|nr:membrane protein insertion efficiency factor YidD [Coxiellaceae bacterium]